VGLREGGAGEGRVENLKQTLRNLLGKGPSDCLLPLEKRREAGKPLKVAKAVPRGEFLVLHGSFPTHQSGKDGY